MHPTGRHSFLFAATRYYPITDFFAAAQQASLPVAISGVSPLRRGSAELPSHCLHSGAQSCGKVRIQAVVPTTLLAGAVRQVEAVPTSESRAIPGQKELAHPPAAEPALEPPTAPAEVARG